jgi:hypothetical protein
MAAIVLGFRRFGLSQSLRVTGFQIKALKPQRFSKTKFSSMITFAGCGGAMAMYLLNDSADCKGALSGEKNQPPGDPSSGPVDYFKHFLKQYSAQINQLGYSGMVGAFSGYAFKRISKEIAFAIGSVFLLLQVTDFSIPPNSERGTVLIALSTP